MLDPYSEIARLERDIEQLSDATERCRKIDAGAKAAMAAGAAWLAAVLLGFARTGGAMTLVALAALLGGLVTYGSNRSTWARLAERLQAAETRRSQLIDHLEMTTVRDRPPAASSRWLH